MKGSKINLRKVFPYIIAISILLELAIILFFINRESYYTMIAGMVAVPTMWIVLYYLFNSLESSIITSMFCIPLLPLVGYLMLRMGLLNFQWIFYIAFYTLSLIAMINNGLFNKISVYGIKYKTKVLRIILFCFFLINIIFAFNKVLSLQIVLLSVIPFSLYFYIAKCIVIDDKKEFLDKLIYFISLSFIMSAIPDTLLYFISMINGVVGVKGYGPLTGNYIMAYIIPTFIIVINKWNNQKGFKSKWAYLTLISVLVMSCQFSRGVLITFSAVMVVFLVFNISNWKKYIPITIIVISVLSFNVMERPDKVGEDFVTQINQEVTKDEDDEMIDLGTEQGSLLQRVLNSQSSTRRAIWKASIDISKDYPITGVGIGNLKYYFDDYTQGKKGYTDAHNLFLNLSSELGLIFSLVSLILIIYIILFEFVNFFRTKDKILRGKRMSLFTICGAILIYGNLTGISLQLTTEVYGFSTIFLFIYLLFYRDMLEIV